ncbi:hypothetical protein NR798_30755 [Archangium gephyra]|uniref:hypothetical protein n=1 Tax=Archangium gephyra TaxID=48 RepID=UPI0035D44454
MPELRGPGVWWKVLLTASALALPAGAADRPRTGQPLPRFTGKDLLGQEHSSQEYQGRPTLLVAITDKDAGEEMRRWFAAADQHASEHIQRESIISLHLPFFVGMGTVRHRVQEQVPRAFWDDTLLDRNGALAGTLGLGSGQEPYVFALDAQGRVLAAVNGKADSPQASRIWSSLNTALATSPSAPGAPQVTGEK